MNIKLIQTYNIEIFSHNIATTYYDKAVIIKDNIIQKYKYKNYIEALSIIVHYEYIYPLSYYIINQSQIISSKFNVSYLLNHPYQSILQYDFTEETTIKYLEIINKYKLINNNDYYFLDISNFAYIAESITLLNNKFNIDLLCPLYTILQQQNIDENNRRLQHIKKLNINCNINILSVYPNITNFIQKYDFFICYIRVFITTDEMRKMFIEQNSIYHQILYLLYGLLQLKKGKNMIYITDYVKTLLSIQVIYLISILFDEMYIDRPIIHSDAKMTGVYIIAKNFKGINKDSALYNNILKLIDDLLKLKIVIKLDHHIWNNYEQISDTHIKTELPYIESIFETVDINDFNFVLLKIKEFNKIHLNSALEIFYRVEAFLQLNEEDREKYAKIRKQEQLNMAINWAKYNNLEIKQNFDYSSLNDFYGKKILGKMILYTHSIQFAFIKHDDNLKNVNNIIDCKINYSNKLLKPFRPLYEKYYKVNRIFDTRPIELYNIIKQKFELYGKVLKDLLQKKYNIKVVTQAWLKMYEILTLYPDLVKKDEELKTFHICEAPGAFIMAIGHYSQTIKNVQVFDWTAQSYNPNFRVKTKSRSTDFKPFGDNYGLMRIFPTKWDWGKDNSGDITNADNIKYYKSKCENCYLLTSDCGVEEELRGDLNSKLMFNSILFMLNNAPINSNCVLKLFLPINTNQYISMLYLLYTYFEKFDIYKPEQNYRSGEYYVICRNKLTVPNNVLELLFEISYDYDPNKLILDIKTIPDTFVEQLISVLDDLTDNYNNYLLKILYFMDTYTFMTDADTLKLKQLIENKNKDWLHKFPVIKK